MALSVEAENPDPLNVIYYPPLILPVLGDTVETTTRTGLEGIGKDGSNLI